MTKISGYIIAKNEEAKVEVALKSLASLCNEIVFIDTGSTDCTKEIARNYTAKIFDFEWEDDFSAARNFAVTKCSEDWILTLDADDEIAPVEQKKIRTLVENCPPQKVGFFLNYQYSEHKQLLVPRLFKRTDDLKYVMPIHEILNIPLHLQSAFEAHPEIIIKHHKDASENEATMQRNIEILEKALQKMENPNAAEASPKVPQNDPGTFHLKFFLGRELFNQKKYEKAVEVFQSLLQQIVEKPLENQEQSLLYNLYLHLGLASEKLGALDNALLYYQNAYSINGKFAEPLVYQANILLYQLHDAASAKKMYEFVLSIPKPITTFPIHPEFYHEFPKQQLHKIAQLNKPIALICGYYGNMNIGDELMLASLLQHLTDYRTIVASYNPKITHLIHKTESVPHKHLYFDKALEQAEIVVIGGGTLFHDQGLKENKTIEYYCGIIQKAEKLGKKVIILGVGVDNVKIPANQKLIRETFLYCLAIVVRDQDSKQRLIDYGVPENRIRTMPDLAFGYHLEAGLQKNNFTLTRSFKTSKKLIGLNFCPPIKNSIQDLKKQIETYFLPFLKKYQDTYDFLFIPGLKDDEQYIAYFEKTLGIKLATYTPQPQSYFTNYFDLLRQCDVIIASRYHLMILGMMLQKPTYAFSYADKTDSLLKEFSGHIRRFEGKLTMDWWQPCDLSKMHTRVQNVLKRLHLSSKSK